MKKVLWIPILLMIAAACGRVEPEFELALHEQEVLDWREWRRERLLTPEGYLNQIGLYWLEQGSYSMGSGSENDIIVPPSFSELIGVFEVDEDGVRFTAEEGIEVLHEGLIVSEINMGADTSDNPVSLSHDSLAWKVIERAGKLAVRLKDYEHPFVKTFGQLPYYDIDPDLRVTARLERYDEPRTVAVNTVIEGFQQFPEAPGIVTFEIDGQTYQLEPTTSGDQLFFVFGDETNNGETYGAGRFVYADAPEGGGELILDFNKSYSPPCAFNDFSTCPVASPRNRLPIRIEAGEMFDSALHYSGIAAN
jgi:uncharacterized protein (DUF1684 family)